MISNLFGNEKIAIHKEYALLKNEITTFSTLLCLKNSIDKIPATSLKILCHLSGQDKRTVISHLSILIKNNFIKVNGDYKCNNNILSIEINKHNSNFGIIKTSTLANIFKQNTSHQLKVYFALVSNLNIHNKNYIYPSLEQLEFLTDMDIRSIRKELVSLEELNIIKKIMFDVFNYKNNKHTFSHNSFGFFIRTGLDEVSDEDIDMFINMQIDKYKNLNMYTKNKIIRVSKNINMTNNISELPST